MAINIEVTKDSSFCPGVDRAFKITEQMLFGGKTRCYSIGPLIHNPEVVKRLGMLGLEVIDADSDQLPDLAGTNVVIRSHGIDTATEQKLESLGAVLVDATCPTVKRAQEAASMLVELGYLPLVIGVASHPEVRSIVRMVVSEYPVLDVYSGKRMLIQSEIEKGLSASFKKSYIICDEMLLRNVQFSTDFQQAIENKQIAQQEAQRMVYVLEKQEMEKKRKIIEAEGESEALRLKGKALADNPSLIQYEYIKLLAPNIQAIVTDQNTIFNFSDFIKGQKK